MNLNQKRDKIDIIDNKIFDLLNERLGIVAEIGKEKINSNQSIYRPERENEIIARLAKKESKYLNIKAIEAIYQEIFAISRNLELPEKVAYLGPLGSYTHQAAEERFGAMSEYLPMTNIFSVFKAVELNQAKYGVIPLENNTNGMVGDTIDLLASSELKIIAEIILPIHHSFATNCEYLKDIKRIYSKDIAFGQCNQFIESHQLQDIERIPVDSTAKAAQFAAKDKNSAAICSKIAGKLYHLPIMFENIEDSNKNKTRFVIISDFINHPSGKDKTSVFANLKDFNKPGILLELLKDFNQRGISLTKIDSRPIKTKSDFSFGFYIDFEGHRNDEMIEELFSLRKDELKWLGSYVKMDK
ncbi:prephenate dehydratase [Helicobacter sp. 13S00477-4]|uniref:prephenate dehydratase n=1 Tax=Helicobacter sp. 13S00477-4 TaxID=1905759 RepID=UPI000BA5F6FC|nr:prephenate dehydratase [Helicobacter sp. 13S00477-4]PAF52056.1 chloride transporter [Helicobacter sp. 13S00477-4]